MQHSEINDVREFSGKLTRPSFFYRQWMLIGNPAYFFEAIVNRYGDFVHYRGLFNFYLVNHPALVKQILMDTHKVFDKDTILYRRFGNIFGNGLVSSEGDDWKRQRKLLQPMFGPKTVQQFFDNMLNATIEMMESWESKFGDGKVFDVAREMDKLTLRNAGEALFSEGFQEQSERIGHWNELINYYCGKPPLPIVRSWWFPSRLNLKVKQTLREFHEFIDQMIEKRRGSGSQNDLLSILLNARHEDDGTPLKDLEIREQVLGMILAGHETTASALAWIFYELNQNQAVLRKLQKEIDSVLNDRLPTISDLAKLKYTRMVIDESLRLHPPFWFENRNPKQDVEIGGEIIPKGSLVIFTRHTLHRHSKFWNEPLKFDPERQDLDNPENARSTYAQVPWGGGPRICIGMHFALMELILIVATIIQRYELPLSATNKHKMAANMTMFPKHGVKVKLQKR